MFPPIPTWNELHPAVVHFAVALLTVAPLFVVLSLVRESLREPLAIAALVLMVLGTAAIYIAVASGEAAEETLRLIPEQRTVLHDHEERAETARTIFTVLTLGYLAIVAIPRAGHFRPMRRSRSIVHVSFVAAYVIGLSILLGAAHQGGLLVHRTGAHVHRGAAVVPLGTQPIPVPEGHEDDE